MTVHHLKLPVDRASIRKLNLGDTVYLNGDIIITAGIPTHHRILEYLDQGKKLPIDLSGGAFFHLGSYSEDDEEEGIKIRYMNPTTSTRFNDMMPQIIEEKTLSIVGGKGGLNDACVASMQKVGCVYLSFLGGGAPILSKSIQKVKDVVWNDLISHYRLVKLGVKDLGPLTVAIDSGGNSIYEDIKNNVEENFDQILRQLKHDREADIG